MPQNRDTAGAEFRRMIRWIALAGVIVVIAALWYLHATGGLSVHMAIATIAGVFLSILLGCGLFAAAFYSDKSGHDRNVSDATREHEEDRP